MKTKETTMTSNLQELATSIVNSSIEVLDSLKIEDMNATSAEELRNAYNLRTIACIRVLHGLMDTYLYVNNVEHTEETNDIVRNDPLFGPAFRRCDSESQKLSSWFHENRERLK